MQKKQEFSEKPLVIGEYESHKKNLNEELRKDYLEYLSSKVF